jgi:hypothetical protein
MLANTAKLNMYGIPRTGKLTRLTQTANPGDLQIIVATGLDWVAGDKIGIASSSMQYNHSDYGIIVSYSNTTGIAVLDRALSYYHWGQATSTGPSYSGVDMRTEAVLLTRNVKI